MSESKEVKGTVYVAPGLHSCRVYAIPHPMKSGQTPADILPEHQRDWSEIGLLDKNLQPVYLKQQFQHLLYDIKGQVGGTFLSARWQVGGVRPRTFN